MSSMQIYILELEQGKYYVGKSENVEERVNQHFQGRGSVWTQKYRPKRLVETIELDNDFNEDFHVLKYMKEYGIDNVRGGSFSCIILRDSEKSVIEKLIHSSNDGCFRCGRTGHFVQNCYARTTVDGKIIKDRICTRCGRNSHNINNCYAKYDKDGKLIDPEEDVEENEGGNCIIS